MLSFLPAPLLGIISLILYILNMIFAPGLIVVVGGLMLLTPVKSWRKKLSLFIHQSMALWWAKISNAIIQLTTKTEWDIRGQGELKKQGWYFLICNHQSWLDIIVLEKVFSDQLPLLKFFMKKELLWTLPVASWACWIIGFPFMKRYSKEYLKKHPEKTGKDLEITKRACEKFKNQPLTIINYIEGTRFTREKQQKQASPYQHLLNPRAGGFSFVLAAMQGHLDNIINVTIIYPDPKTNLWSFMCGKVKKIIVHYEILPVPKEWIGNYHEDPEFRKNFHQQVNELWQKKDSLIEDTLKQERL